MKSKRNKTVFEAGHRFSQSKMLLFQTRRGWFLPIDGPNKGKVLIRMEGRGKAAEGERFPKKSWEGERKTARKTQNLMIRHLLFHCTCCIPLAMEPLVSDGIGSGDRRRRSRQGLHVEYTVSWLLLSAESPLQPGCSCVLTPWPLI